MRPALPILMTMVLLTAPAAGAPRLPITPGEERARLLRERGGNTESEAAVASGLAWLARQQEKDGSWGFDGSSKDQIAATGMALLPFIAAGETHKTGDKYKKVVAYGLALLTARLEDDGSFLGSTNAYAHAIATIALCDAARVSKDDALKAKAKRAVDYIVKAQGKNGSWGYTAGTEGDTSIVGWQVQALAAARSAGIEFDHEKVFKKADQFLQGVSTDGGAKYGYREKGASQTLTPVGLLSRHSIGTMATEDRAFARGVEFLKDFTPQRGYFDMYYYFYATRVMHLYDGPAWHKLWNPKMRDMLIELQDKGDDEATKGSWRKDTGFIGASCGRLGTTALAVLTLQVYYRDARPQKPDGGGVKELKK
jgi:hypothetical protein